MKIDKSAQMQAFPAFFTRFCAERLLTRRERFDIMISRYSQFDICGGFQVNEQIKEHLTKYPREILDMYYDIRQLIFDSVCTEPTEALWAKLPSYYAGEAFVRIIPFKDHIKIEAKAIAEYREALAAYKLTPKGMLQIFLKQELPADVLKEIFAKTLNDKR
jgi:hypothetical protein